MRDDDEGDVGLSAVVLDDLRGHQAVGVVESVEGLVEDEEVGGFDEGAGEEAEALFAAGHAKEGAVCEVVDAEASHPGETGLALLGTRTNVESNAVVQSAGDDVNSWQIAHISAMHLWTDVADVALDVPDAFSRAAFASKEFNITGVGLWVVGTDEAEECGFAGAVGALQCPVLAAADGPREVVEDGALAVADGDVGEAEDRPSPDLARSRNRSYSSVAQDGLTFSQPVASFATRQGGEGLCRDIGWQPGGLPSLKGGVGGGSSYHSVDEVGDVAVACEEEYDLQPLFLDEFLQGVAQLLARFGVEADEGAVEDEEARGGGEGALQLVFAELAAGKADDIAAVDHGGRFVDIVLIPTLLQVVGGIAVAVGVAEGEDADVVAGVAVGAALEMVVYFVGAEEGIAAGEDFDEAGFAGGVEAHDGDLFARVDVQVQGFPEAEVGVAGDAVFDGDDGEVGPSDGPTGTGLRFFHKGGGLVGRLRGGGGVIWMIKFHGPCLCSC